MEKKIQKGPKLRKRQIRRNLTKLSYLRQERCSFFDMFEVESRIIILISHSFNLFTSVAYGKWKTGPKSRQGKFGKGH